MKMPRLISITFLITMLTIVGSVKFLSWAQEGQQNSQLATLEDKEKKGTLKLRDYAQLAKARGQKKILVPSLAILFPTFRSEDELDANIKKYTLVIAEPIKVKAYVDGERITSWYKFKIVEMLSQAPPIPWYTIDNQPPEEFLPVNEDEFLTHVTQQEQAVFT